MADENVLSYRRCTIETSDQAILGLLIEFAATWHLGSGRHYVSQISICRSHLYRESISHFGCEYPVKVLFALFRSPGSALYFSEEFWLPFPAVPLPHCRLFSLLIFNLALLIGCSLVILLFDCQHRLMPKPLRFTIILFFQRPNGGRCIPGVCCIEQNFLLSSLRSCQRKFKLPKD